MSGGEDAAPKKKSRFEKLRDRFGGSEQKSPEQKKPGAVSRLAAPKQAAPRAPLDERPSAANNEPHFSVHPPLVVDTGPSKVSGLSGASTVSSLGDGNEEAKASGSPEAQEAKVSAVVAQLKSLAHEKEDANPTTPAGTGGEEKQNEEGSTPEWMKKFRRSSSRSKEQEAMVSTVSSNAVETPTKSVKQGEERPALRQAPTDEEDTEQSQQPAKKFFVRSRQLSYYEPAARSNYLKWKPPAAEKEDSEQSPPPEAAPQSIHDEQAESEVVSQTSDKESSGYDWDSTIALKTYKHRPLVVVPVRTSSGRTETPTETPREEDPNNREPGGHRLYEDYNRPPPNFTVPVPPRHHPPSVTPTTSSQGETSELTSEPGRKRLPDKYYDKKQVIVSRGVVLTRMEERDKVEPLRTAPRKQPPSKRVVLERWRSAHDCDGVKPKEHMYPSIRISVDSPGEKLGQASAEEKLAQIKRQVAMAEHIAVLQKMKHYSEALQELLSASDGHQIKTPNVVIKGNARADDKERNLPPRQKSGSSRTSRSSIRKGKQRESAKPKTAPKPTFAEYKDLVAWLEEDLRSKQATHDKLIQLNAASQKAKMASTPEEQLLKTLEADMLREQLEYDSLMEQVSQTRHAPKLSYHKTSPRQMTEQELEAKLGAQLYTKRLALASGELDGESHPFDECESQTRATTIKTEPKTEANHGRFGGSVKVLGGKDKSIFRPQASRQGFNQDGDLNRISKNLKRVERKLIALGRLGKLA